MSELNYRPNGEVQGDSKSIPESNGSTSVGYDYGKSLPDFGQDGLKTGYRRDGGISGDTKSDKGFA